MITAAVLSCVLAGGPTPVGPSIRWEHHFDHAVRRARSQNRPLMVDFWAEWCSWCTRLDRTTYVDPDVVRLVDDFVAVKVDTESGSKAEAIAARYDVSSLPTILFLTPSGRLVLRVSGFQGPGQFPRTLETARGLADKVMQWEATLKRDGSNAAALMALGDHMYRQEAYREAQELLGKARKVDQKLPSAKRKRLRMILGIMAYYDRRFSEAESLLREGLDARPPDDYDAKLLYLLGRAYMAHGKTVEARKCLTSVLTQYPQSHIVQEAREALATLERAADR
jgi:thioredoxin-like negative regulator of GroEL